MGLFSQSEIETILTNLKAAISVVINGGEEYSLNDGMGTMRVKRTTLNDLQKAYHFWIAELEDLDSSGDIVSMEVG